MNHKRSVVVGGALSALLLSASGAFAVGSGLFGSAAADNVGTFQAIEQAASRDTQPVAPGSTTKPKASTPTSVALRQTASGSNSDDSVPGTTAPSMGSTDPEDEPQASQPRAEDDDDSDEHGTTTTEPAQPPRVDDSTTSTTHVEYEDEHEDDGREGDD